ncbi:MAG: hypothetical protein EXR72_24455 [Myxococcales bacterium]|nr:hypothetical protein [Myxococcales bacterium]
MAEEIVSERQIEMLWSCTSCGHKNLGRYKECRGCGNAKDGSETYEMPGDPAAAASVSDGNLLAMARAGADWKCSFCGSDQRAVDGRCRQCGASPTVAPSAPSSAPTPSRRRAGSVLAIVGGTLVAVFGALAGLLYLGRPPTLAVVEVGFEHVISVERYEVAKHEGFAEQQPAEAFAVHALGKRHHHDDQVPDGFRTEEYFVDVPDGTRTEWTSERVACGRDCTDRPRVCNEKCSTNKNGFASCKTSCTGGGQSCTTRYCSERRSHQVPKTRSERRTRQVQRYRAVPRSAEWFAWSVREWRPNREVKAAGNTTATRWPGDEEVRLGVGLADGEKERASRAGRYRVLFADGKGARHPYVPATLDEYQQLPLGEKRRLRLEEGKIAKVFPPDR